MNSRILKTFTILLCAFSMALFFQNCSEATFSDASTASGKTGLDVGAPEEEPVDPEVPADPMDDPIAVVPNAFGCTENDITDIRLNIESVSLGGTQLTAAVGIQSLVSMAEGFNVLLDQPAKGGQVRLKLSEINNQVVDTAGQAYALKTPSAQQSGVKIVAQGNLRLKGNTAYTIRFFLDPNSQVVRTGNGRCILKPTLRMTASEEVEF